MRISDIVSIGKEYAVLGIGCTIFIMAVFLLGYVIIYRKQLKGTKKVKPVTLIAWGIFFVYVIVVLGATLGIRAGGMGTGINMHLFSSYKMAWNGGLTKECNNLVFNILMFVPLGVLLPLMLRLCRKFWCSYLAGFGFSVAIEIIQLVTKRGIFEVDDIFNNTLGCVIGYGIGMILLTIVNAIQSSRNDTVIDKTAVEHKRGKTIWIVCAQIPLLLTVAIFAGLFMAYQKQELGNMNITYNYRQDMSNIHVSTEKNFSENRGKSDVYQAITGSKEDTLETAAKIFAVAGTEVDTSQNDAYKDTMVYYSMDGNYCVWVDYVGLTTWYTDYTSMDSEKQSGVSLDEVKKMLAEFLIEIPEGTEFTDNGDGTYIIKADMLLTGDVLIDGQCQCTITKQGKIHSFHNNIITYKKYKEYEIISEKEAYEEILKGKFLEQYLYTDSKMKEKEVIIDEVSISYLLDSKGFYEPVYCFDGTCNGEDRSICIPACAK